MPMYQNDKKIKHIIRNGKRYGGKYFSNGNTYDTKDQTKNRIAALSTDKSRYNPGENAKITVSADNLTGNDGNLWLELFDNFGLIVASNIVNFRAGKNNIVIESSLPVQYTDFVGYTLKATLNIGHMTNVATSAIDVSSDWTRYPRYSSLTIWNQDPEDVKKDIDNLNKLHINSILYYDAIDRPQNPIPNDVSFNNWIGREVKPKTVRAAVDTQHSYGQAAMLYDMICASSGAPSDEGSNMQGDPNFIEITRKDGTKGVESKYGIFNMYHNDTNSGAGTFNDAGEQTTINMLAPYNNRSNVTNQVQYYYNPASTGWAKYISNAVADALKRYNFDGWQGDTPGDMKGITYDDVKSGNYSNPFNLNSTLGYFANMVKQDAMKDYKLSINAVSGVGQSDLNKSNADLMYTEIWNAPNFQVYSHLVNFINNVKVNSNKSLIVPAYMYGSYTPDKNQFLNNAILLKDIVIFASGGDSMELVDDMLQIFGAYYPDATNSGRIVPKPSLNDPETGQLRKLYDFITAYEAILRGDSLTMDNSMVLVKDYYGNYLNSSEGSANHVYTISRSSSSSSLRTISLINLVGVDNINWQVNNSLDESQKANVKEQDALTVSYFGSSLVSEVYMSSPDDPYNSMPKKLDYRYINGGIEFTIPSLKYWDLIYMRYK